MIVNKALWFAALCLAFTGCAEPETAPPSESRLGISSFEIDEHASGMTIVGRGVGGDEIGRVSLSIGTFESEEYDGPVYGRQLSVEVNGRRVDHASEGLMPLSLPLGLRARDLAAFVLEPVVSSRLALRGINFEGVAPDDDEERAHVACVEDFGGTYLGAVTHSGCSTSSNSKWAVSGSITGEYRCCNTGAKNAAERRCVTPVAGGVSTACGSTGSAGCALCWTEPKAPAPGGWTSCFAGYWGSVGWIELCYPDL